MFGEVLVTTDDESGETIRFRDDIEVLVTEAMMMRYKGGSWDFESERQVRA